LNRINKRLAHSGMKRDGVSVASAISIPPVLSLGRRESTLRDKTEWGGTLRDKTEWEGTLRDKTEWGGTLRDKTEWGGTLRDETEW